MHLLATILVAAEAKAPLLMPPIAFAGIAFAVFLALGVVTWSYRDVAHRHQDKFQGGVNDHQHTGAGH
ncbi:hypothetical protein [Galbitalea soli]|uniref:Uncharacterized protein n=1 Tax=Galbitalea soli TaxID=1268042 RepID=A0A7C9PNK9_9MICO|nr:hypothetical protein [Galbitalea soli]NEM91732.1 hypothetical protein [Galbitalea soli]NYJ30428.1 hypothetical protein [Galbitalea soli]